MAAALYELVRLSELAWKDPGLPVGWGVPEEAGIDAESLEREEAALVISIGALAVTLGDPDATGFQWLEQRVDSIPYSHDKNHLANLVSLTRSSITRWATDPESLLLQIRAYEPDWRASRTHGYGSL